MPTNRVCNSKSRKWQFFIAFFTLLLSAGFITQSDSLRNPTAPNITLTTLSGQRIALHSWRGKAVLVTFWATDCPACITEIPDLKTLYQRYHRQGLEMIAIAMYYDPPSHVVAMSRAKQLPYPVALDLKSLHARAFGGVDFTPTTFLISPKGQIVSRITGALDLETIQQRIQTLL